MDESHYRTLIEEVRNDIAEAERTIEELQPLEAYLQKKIDSPGRSASNPGGSAPKSGGEKSSGGRSSSRPAAKAEPEPSGTGGKGMQTVEFGPDGFPST